MDDVLEWGMESFAEAEFDMMGMIKLSSLNKVVIEYALNAMVEYTFLGCAYWYLMCMYFPFKLFKSRFGHKSEAVMNTQGLSRSLVVASCTMDTRDVAYSDFSGKKQRQTVLKDFPIRRNDFNAWYRGDSKPYQHKDLYDRINQRLGKIGSFAQVVKHPIGYCAEQNVTNRLMLDGDAQMDDIRFSVAIRPRTGEIVDYCDNCKALFGGL